MPMRYSIQKKKMAVPPLAVLAMKRIIQQLNSKEENGGLNNPFFDKCMHRDSDGNGIGLFLRATDRTVLDDLRTKLQASIEVVCSPEQLQRIVTENPHLFMEISLRLMRMIGNDFVGDLLMSSKGLRRVDLTACDLTGLNVEGLDLIGIQKLNLAYARNIPQGLIRKVFEVKVSDINLNSCDLTGLNVAGLDLNGIQKLCLWGAENIPQGLIRKVFEATVADINLNGCDLTGLN
jgi:uncharacterized protein YjbI with pentapeptide repeats